MSRGRRRGIDRAPPGRHRCACPEAGNAGFTLVETIVAFAVLALILTVLLGGLSRMTTGGRRAEILREALALAQARLDGLGVVEPLTPGESTGRFDNGFVWRLRIGNPRMGAPASGMAGAWVEIAVSAPADGTSAPPTVSLAGFKLAAGSRR
jgi:type II secretory pathway pseudopilin PulG